MQDKAPGYFLLIIVSIIAFCFFMTKCFANEAAYAPPAMARIVAFVNGANEVFKFKDDAEGVICYTTKYSISCIKVR